MSQRTQSSQGDRGDQKANPRAQHLANADAAKRLKWRCRRGIRELDLILGEFLERRFGTLSRNQQEVFAHLLEQNDQDILAWLAGKLPPETEAMQVLIHDLRMLWREQI
ncbi:MAG: succinate dehydrogenase assembly factor 2 [Gammaproteobacteria bacterium]